MAKPQLENGYTPIANELLERLMMMHLAPNQWQVLLCIIRKTYGFHKKVDYIANFQIGEATGLGKTVVSRVLHNLHEIQLITRKGKIIGFQKDWEKWKGLTFQPILGGKLAKQPTSEPKEPSEIVDQKDDRASQSNKLAAWRAKVYHRDDLICRICGRDADTIVQAGMFLNGHHILPWAEHPELRFDVNNGLTLCDECHYCYHYAKSTNTYEFIKEVFEFRKLAELLTKEKLAELHEKLSIPLSKLAKRSQKVSSPDVTQKKKETITKDTIQKKAPKKRGYFFDNILLTEEEYNKLAERFGEAGTKDRLENLSLYKKSKGRKYASDYATILAWDKRDKKGGGYGTHRRNTTQLTERASYHRPED